MKPQDITERNEWATSSDNQFGMEDVDLEALLNTELDLPHGLSSKTTHFEENSPPEALNVSLELLALQSPHGCMHQWDNNTTSEAGRIDLETNASRKRDIPSRKQSKGLHKALPSTCEKPTRNRRSNSDSSQHASSSRRRPQSTVRKRKIKHGGIYSLLLNDPISRDRKCSPVLLENVSQAELFTSVAGHTPFDRLQVESELLNNLDGEQYP